MSRDPGRYALITPEDRDAVLALLEGSGETALANRINRSPLHDVLSEERATADAEAVLNQVAELEMTREEQVALFAAALRVATGALGYVQSEAAMREVFRAVHARRRAEEERHSREVKELAVLARDAAEAAGLGVPAHSHPVMPHDRGDVIGHLFHEHGLRASTTPSLGHKTTAQLRQIHEEQHREETP